MLSSETAREAMRIAGVRVTPQRLMVVDVLTDNRSHPTVEEVCHAVRAHYPSISLATVYHTLSMLARHGLILELHGSKDGLRCDPDTTPHAHAYCESCGQVRDVALTLPSDWQTEKPDGFHMTAVDISIYGRCAHCQAPAPECDASLSHKPDRNV